MGPGQYRTQHPQTPQRWKPIACTYGRAAVGPGGTCGPRTGGNPTPPPPPSPPSGFTFPRHAVSVSRQNAVRCGERRCGEGRCGEGRCGGAPPVRAVPEPPPPPSSPPLPNHHRCGPAPQECGPSPRSALIWANGAKRPRSPPASGDPPRPRTSLPAPHVRSGPASLLQTSPPPRQQEVPVRGGHSLTRRLFLREIALRGERGRQRAPHRVEPPTPHRTAPPRTRCPTHPGTPRPPGTPLPPPPTSSSIASRPPSRASPRRTMAAPHRTAPHRSGPAPLWAAAAGTELCTA